MRDRAGVALVLLAALVGCSSPPPATGPLRDRVPHRGPLRFAVVGDFGTGDETEHAVAEELRAWATRRDAALLVTTGDNVYEDGNPENFDDAWLEPYAWVEREGIDVVASLGNHDVGTAGGAPVMELLGIPNRWYARRYGPLELVVLDGNDLEDPAQLAFVADALRRSSAPWQIVVVHQAPYTCGKHDGEADDVRAAIEPVISGAGVDLVLSGHDHNYQRFPPIGGVTFIVSGGGGADLHELEGCDEETPEPSAAFDDAHHFLVGVATPRVLRISAVAVPSGAVVDTLTLRS